MWDDISGALNNSNFDGNTILLECENSKNVYISGLEFFDFRTNDIIIDYLSLMGNNMTPYVFARERGTHISYQHVTSFLKMKKMRRVRY